MPLEETIQHFAPGHSDVEGIEALLAGGGAEGAALRGILGGKGAGLHALAARGFRVPCGFTLPTRWCAAYHAAGRVLPPGLREEVAGGVTALAARTGRALGDADRPLRVAVRSGAAASMPGMMETVLGVGSLEGILAAIERVFRSWESDRAVAYRERRGLTGLRGTAVVIQEMVPAEEAGVAFTADAATGEPDITVEAVRGLGEALVSGEVTPERHRFRRPGLERIEERILPGGRILSAARLEEVVALALEVERAFGHPVDIEWAAVGEETWLLQVRAVAVSAPAVAGPASASASAARRARLRSEAARLRAPGVDGEAAPGDAVFIRHNLDQGLSHPTPMTWDLLGELFGREGAFQQLYGDLGFHPSARVRKEGFLVTICGRIFADPIRAAELFYGTRALRHELEALRRRPELLDGPPSTWDRAAASPFDLLRTLWRAGRAQRRIDSLCRSFPARFRTEILPRYHAWCRAKGAQDLSALAPAALLAELGERASEVYRRFPRAALKLSFLGATAHAGLRDLLERLLGEVEGGRAAMALASRPDSDLAPDLNRALASLCRGEIGREAFLEAHGHRGPAEMELARPRWREDPSALAAVASVAPAALAAAGARRDGAVEDQEDMLRAEEERIEHACREAGGEAAVASFRRLRDETRRLLPWREAWKHHWMWGVSLVRSVLLELDRRLGLDGAVFYLTREELGRIVSSGARPAPGDLERVRSRRDDERAERDIRLAEAVTAEYLERMADGRTPAVSPEQGPDAATLRGEPLSPGSGEGRAWIAAHPEDRGAPDPPFVLVCPSTDPNWTPVLARASAVVVERGGALSHGAIVCRDFGVPAVLLPGATAVFTPGEPLWIDGGAGTIERRRDGEVPGGTPAAGGDVEALPAEPWVPPARRRLALRSLGGLAAAITVSMALVMIPAARSALEPALRSTLDWTLAAGWRPWQCVGFAALASAVLAAALQLAAGDRALLARMRVRLAWYRRSLRAARKAGCAGAAAVLERRLGQASTERALELLRPVGWSFLPFCLGLIWVTDRFSVEPIRPGTMFTVSSVVRPGSGRLRHVRLDVGVDRLARTLDAPFQKLQPNRDEPWQGPYRARWRLEALGEGSLALAVATRDERLEKRVLITTRRDIAPPDAEHRRRPGAPDGCEIVSLEVEHEPVAVELPDAAFRLADRIARWITGGRGITPRQAALGPLTSFLVGSVFLALVFQRLTGMR